MTLKINLDGVAVGDGCPVYLVAEIGQNHNGDMYDATRLVGEAVRAGVDAVKFQHWGDLQSDFTQEKYNQPVDPSSHFGTTYGQHREHLNPSLEDLWHIQERIKYNEWPVSFFCTPLDCKAVEELQKLDVPFYKIASRDLENLDLVAEVARTKKPVIMSTGMSGFDAVGRAVNVVSKYHAKLILLHCVSAYPTDYADVNLTRMEQLRATFGCLVGLSDHSVGPHQVPMLAVKYGACLIEKHVTLARAQPRGSDHKFSLEPDGIRRWVRDVEIAQQIVGSGGDMEKPPRSTRAAREKLGRSLVAARDLLRFEVIDRSDVAWKSPGTGLSVLSDVLGKRANVDIKKGTIFQPDMVT